MDKIFLLFCMIFPFNIYLSGRISGQEVAGLSMGADLVSRYIWRGINLGGNSAHIQPYINYSFEKTGLSFGVWGSYGMGYGSPGSEADLMISYTPVAMLSFTVNDYFFPDEIPFGRERYFNYRKGKTRHTVEGMIRVNGFDGFPFHLLFAINLYGVDGTNEEGDNYFAKYFEMGYEFTGKASDVSLILGMALDNPRTDLGATGWYADSRGIINAGICMKRQIMFNERFYIPVSSSLICNPKAGNIYIVFGLSSPVNWHVTGE